MPNSLPIPVLKNSSGPCFQNEISTGFLASKSLLSGVHEMRMEFALLTQLRTITRIRNFQFSEYTFSGVMQKYPEVIRSVEQVLRVGCSYYLWLRQSMKIDRHGRAKILTQAEIQYNSFSSIGPKGQDRKLSTPANTSPNYHSVWRANTFQ